MTLTRVTIINAFRLDATAAFAITVITPALAHHGGGTYDNTRTIEQKGTLTKEQVFVDYSKASANRKWRCSVSRPA